MFLLVTKRDMEWLHCSTPSANTSSDKTSPINRRPIPTVDISPIRTGRTLIMSIQFERTALAVVELELQLEAERCTPMLERSRTARTEIPELFNRECYPPFGGSFDMMCITIVISSAILPFYVLLRSTNIHAIPFCPRNCPCSF